MMKKVWPVLLAVVLVFGLALLGCGSSGGGGGGGGDFVPFEWDATKDGPLPVTVWGSNAPEYDDETGVMTITASGSTGFKFVFDDLRYKLNRSDIFIFTYEVEVTTPKAVITVKSVKGNDFAEVGGDSDWGRGKGREYVLGEEELSNYDGPKVKGTWDAETKTGTFEVLMKYMSSSADAIGFQHNFWCDMGTPGVKNAEDSEYTLRFTKIENKKGEAPVVTPPTGNASFDNAVGLTEGIGTYGSGAHDFDEDAGILTISGNGGFYVPLPAGFTVADTVSIEYVCLDVSDEAADIKFIKKQDNGWTDVNEPDETKYPTFDTTQVSTITVTGFSAAGVAAGRAWFQTNGTFTAKIKIISITKIAGDPIKVNIPVSGAGLKPAAGEVPVTTVDTTQFTGTVSWAPTVATTFTNGTAYTATIALTAKTGYTFAGVEANAINVVGADTVTHAAGTTTTLSITAVFPAATAPAPDLPITFAAGDVKGEAATITLETDGSGFTITQTAGYGNAYAYFKVTFAAGYKLSDYAFIDLTMTLLNTTYKPIYIAAYEVGDEEPTGSMAAEDVIAGGTDNVGKDQDVAYPVTLPITVDAVDANVVWIAIRSHAASGDSYKITDIVFHNTPPAP